MDFLKELENTLKQDDRFLGENRELLKTKVYDAAMSLDVLLLQILIENTELKEHFFTNVNGTLVFDKMKFIWTIDSKEFLPDSYTMFKNKIGLVDNNGVLINHKQDVTLVWPYKDCVLEGGQTKEDEKRDEVFYNETLAPHEVNRLLYPKVLTKAKKYTENGIEEITNFSEKDNLIIKGNNLLALSSLLKNFEGKVSCIYIDPPYNTGNDSFKYNDNFNHSSWLTFMKNRLELAKKLLTDDGSIYIQIDNNESAYLKILLDDIFGFDNFRAEIIWVLKGASGYKALANNYIRGHETIYFYSKTKKYKFNKQYLPYDEKQLKRFSSIDEDGRKYKTITSARRLYLDEAKGVPLTDLWDDIASFQTIVNSPEIIGFDTQKPEKLIERMLLCSTNANDIVMDFHIGSGTTVAVAHKMGRRYIGIEQMDYINTITVPRLQRVIDGEQGGISKDVNWNGGGSFVYCELMELNEKYINNLKNTKTTEEILTIMDEVVENGLIKPSILPEDLRKHREEIKQMSVEDQRGLVLKLLDKNKLYVNLSDLDDENLHISEKDKEFNRSFYHLSEEDNNGKRFFV